MYCDESVLLGLKYGVDTHVKVDTNILDVERGRFAIICVEIDLPFRLSERSMLMATCRKCSMKIFTLFTLDVIVMDITPMIARIHQLT